MESPYELSYDTQFKIFHITLIGFWTIENAEEFSRVFQQEITDCSDAQFVAFVDVSRFNLQTLEVQKKIKENIQFAFAHGCQKTARLINRDINKLQLERISKELMDETKFKFSKDKEELFQWLKE